MSLYTSLREEVMEKLVLDKEAIKAELAGFLLTKLRDSLVVKVDTPSDARKLCKYLDTLKEKYALVSGIKGHYEVQLKGFPDFLRDPKVYLNDDLHWGDFLRGLFWSCGSMVKPWKGYHLEIGISNNDLASLIESSLRERGISFGTRDKKGRHYLTFRNLLSIKQLLRAMGAERSLKRLDEIRTVKKIREKANREANCDTANAERIVSASLRDLFLINLIGEKLDKLPPKLREVAELRIKHPSLSLKELGAMLSPPLSKMGVYRALRKIRDYFNNWKEGKDFVSRKGENKQL